MPSSTYTTAPVFVQRLGRHHFAHLRAVAQGVAITESAKRYLGLETGQHGMAAHQQVIERVKAIARRRNEAKWRLIGLAIRPEPTNVQRPSLEQFVEERSLEDWSENEAMEFYREAFPDNLKTLRRQRLYVAQLELLARLESLDAETPQASDQLSGWFDSALVAKFRSADLFTLEDLRRSISSGGRWYSRIPGVGRTKAERITNHLRSLLPYSAFGAPALFRLEATPILPNLLTFASESRVALPSPARSSPVVAMKTGAKSDIEAIEAWVTARSGSLATAKAYRREATRLLLWLRYERSGIALADMRAEDCLAYMAFLQHIPDSWISKRHAAAGTEGWAPFRGQISNRSRSYAIGILLSLFAWLQAAQHLHHNPWVLVNLDTGELRGERLPQSKALSEAAINEVLRWMRDQAPSPSRDRAIFTVVFTEAVGLRSSELIHAKLGDLQLEPEGWFMQVLGKGAKHRIVAIPRQAFEALQLYLAQRGLEGVETAAPETPLLASTVDGTQPIGYQALYEHIRRWLTKSIAQSELPAHERRRLDNVSTHWLRHTFGTRAVARQVPLDVIQAQMGHASIQTTMSIYGRAPLQRRAEELAKAFG